MQISEKDLEDLIFNDLSEDPFNLLRMGVKFDLLQMPNDNQIHWFRQIDLKQYGRADIIGYSRFMGKIYVDVVELKNVPIQPNDINQVFRYKTAVQEIIKNTFKGRFRAHVTCYLMGPSIAEGHWILNNSDCQLYTFDFSLRGFSFERHSYQAWRLGAGDLKLNDCGFSQRVSTPSIYTHGQIQESTDSVLG